MPTSVTFRAAEAAPRGLAGRGFSLLELLIVLALLGLMTALVAPRLQRTYEAIAGSGERAEVRRQLGRLPRLARIAGEPIVVGEGDAAGLAAVLALPEGWRVTPLAALRVEANGLCHATVVRVEGLGDAEDLSLSMPTCEVADAP